MERKVGCVNDQIDKFCEAIAMGLIDRSIEPGIDVWPQPVFSAFIGDYYIHREIILQLYRILNLLRERGLGIQEVSKLFLYPSRTAHLMYFFVQDLCSEKEVKIRTKVAQRLLKIMQILRNNDPFCDSGRNLVWSDETLSQILRSASFTDIEALSDPVFTRRIIGKNLVTLSGYCELLYFANLSCGREIHGPYETKYGKLLVREYFDIKPSFWAFSKELPFNTIKFLTVYPNDMHINFDFGGRLYCSKTFMPELSHACIKIDGESLPLTITTLNKTLKKVENVIDMAIQEVKALDKTQLIYKWIEGKFWVLKPLRDYLGEDWHPPQRLYEQIQTEKPDDWIIQVMKKLVKVSKTKRLSIMKKMFDPRISRKKRKIFDLLGDNYDLS